MPSPSFCRPGSPRGTRAASRPSGWRSERPDLPCGPTGATGTLFACPREAPGSGRGCGGNQIAKQARNQEGGKPRCGLPMIGGPDGPRGGAVNGSGSPPEPLEGFGHKPLPGAGASAPYGSPALRSTRATRSGAMTREAKRHRGTTRRGQGPTLQGCVRCGNSGGSKATGFRTPQRAAEAQLGGAWGRTPLPKTARDCARIRARGWLTPNQPPVCAERAA